MRTCREATPRQRLHPRQAPSIPASVATDSAPSAATLPAHEEPAAFNMLMLVDYANVAFGRILEQVCLPTILARGCKRKGLWNTCQLAGNTSIPRQCCRTNCNDCQR